MSMIFDLPDVKCKYSLNTIENTTNHSDNPIYGSLNELLEQPFENCKVGKNNEDNYLPEIRNGKFRYTNIVFENNEELNSLIMNKLEEFVEDYKEFLEFEINNEYQVLKYEENDFFHRHQDNIIDDKHYGTLLIFPPALGNLKHKGGKLLLDNDEFESSSNTTWKAMFLYCNTFHEIEKVISGQRIVFKTKLIFNEDYNDELEQDIYSNVCDVGFDGW